MRQDSRKKRHALYRRILVAAVIFPGLTALTNDTPDKEHVAKARHFDGRIVIPGCPYYLDLNPKI